MLDTGRRSILAGLSAAPAAIVAATLPTTVLARPAAPDAMSGEVADLTRLYDAAMARTAKANDALDAAEARVVQPAVPEALYAQPNDPLAGLVRSSRCGARYWYGSESVDRLREGSVLYAAPKVHARRAEVIAAYDQWTADADAAKDAAGYSAASAECVAVWQEMERPVLQRIIELRSAEPAALRLKARVYLATLSPTTWRNSLDDAVSFHLKQNDGPGDDALAASIIRDLVTAHAGAAA